MNRAIQIARPRRAAISGKCKEGARKNATRGGPLEAVRCGGGCPARSRIGSRDERHLRRTPKLKVHDEHENERDWHGAKFFHAWKTLGCWATWG